mgnify:CR=1 FL=1
MIGGADAGNARSDDQHVEVLGFLRCGRFRERFCPCHFLHFPQLALLGSPDFDVPILRP